jgi:hypothetical protein
MPGCWRTFDPTPGLARGDDRHCSSPFFTLWKDADPDIPILKEAKAEYARLQ